MNKISQKRDIDDMNTIFEFAKKIQSQERLKLLFIFTVADMKATGKSIWNTWNKFPLEQLFLKTRNLKLIWMERPLPRTWLQHGQKN